MSVTAMRLAEESVAANHQRASAFVPQGEVVIDCNIDKIFYGDFLAVNSSSVPIEKKKITGFIGPSGCGKSTVLRSLNRMNDLISSFRLEGQVNYHGKDIYAKQVDPVIVRRYIGMVFQQPNPFSMSIYDNVAFGLRLNRFKGDVDERVQQALERAALWNEVKDKLKNSGLSLSGGQQQRLCIARAIATEPDVLLMDEPCSALDPIATRQVEELMLQLKERYTVAMVTHNMQQAMRVADTTCFFGVDLSKGGRTGYLVEMGETRQVFEDPVAELTKQYVSGEFS
ncbi:phosphate ABC transporter ATP-binding protein PstB [Neptunomonas phycophila]|uniref:Phosphate ABC transporter ATP-binding protein PstB n=1 Tax=Neptunomonas phycophila TaxID=1572645 RepID=A0ABT9EXD2_9GAMM|nr:MULTISPECIES: phosphate ABC transporter ATP-binding protein PstB [Neptunomonas]MBT3144478.1 phosphate ABC transporter ATP-binding protein [Neptunomonas phycophila]MDN2660624.1 phosphate ABC transporter ATP-binding protein PstB [Neptunomonas sp. CHC150]MDO6784173.1 phosphate ABC transporter ATP-binding protein PstB [Neptunomonas phycophila]MDP2523589.1 phosphate ABC transporter ATP-binding protein PstB [Neptunomonas phycophila]